MTTAAPQSKRKPQARSAATRESVLDAALVCLVERGFARTATADVAERAGVSRGALLHHFPTRAGLLAATVEHLAERRLAELRDRLGNPASPGDDIDAAVDFVWESFTDSTAYASLELVVAARTDDDLLANLRPVADRFERLLRPVDGEIAHNDDDPERANAFRNLVMVAMQGLAVLSIVKNDDAYIDGVLDLLKQLCRENLTPTETTRGT